MASLSRTKRKLAHVGPPQLVLRKAILGIRDSSGLHYSVNPDCTGTVTVTNGNQPPIHLQMIVTQSGNTIQGW